MDVYIYIHRVCVHASLHISSHRWALCQHGANTTRRCTCRSASGCVMGILREGAAANRSGEWMVRGAIPQAGSDTQDWATHGDATPTKEACIVTIDGLATAVNTGRCARKDARGCQPQCDRGHVRRDDHSRTVTDDTCVATDGNAAAMHDIEHCRTMVNQPSITNYATRESTRVYVRRMATNQDALGWGRKRAPRRCCAANGEETAMNNM